MWGDSFSAVGDTFSTVEVVQYSGGITSIQWNCGGYSVHWADNISICRGITSVHADIENLKAPIISFRNLESQYIHA